MRLDDERRSENVEDRRGIGVKRAVAGGGIGTILLVGDDRLQRQSQGYVIPDSFTHGTSEQRVRWFRRGMETGDIAACDTFQAADP